MSEVDRRAQYPEMPQYMSGSYARPIRHMQEVRDLLICNPPLIGDAIKALEGAILDLGGPKLWGSGR